MYKWILAHPLTFIFHHISYSNDIVQDLICCYWSFAFVFWFLTVLFCRSWRTDLCKGSCALVCVSVEHDDSLRTGAVKGVVLESQYLLEPCGTARTRLTHISRVDLRCGLLLTALILEALISIAEEKYALSAVLIPGGGLQNGTTRLLATCALMKPKWSAPLFTCWIRRALRPRLEQQEPVFILLKCYFYLAWLYVTSRGGSYMQMRDLVSFQAAELYCNVTVSSHSHTEEHNYLSHKLSVLNHIFMKLNQCFMFVCF